MVSLVNDLTRGLGGSTATLNQSQSSREWFDLTYQLLGIGFALVPVALVLYLVPGLLVRPRWADDAIVGVVLAAGIGLPGLGVYAVGRYLGVTAHLVLAPDHTYWWTVPVLVLAAVQNAVLEEVVVVGYLTTRLKDLGWSVPLVIAASALLRGGYHLYQGFGQGLGNVIMGVVFAYWFHRTRRVMPLIIAHALMDSVVFIGYLVIR